MGVSTLPSRSAKPTARSSFGPIQQTGERYIVNRALGRGGMAFVYEATEIATSRRVALKRLQRNPDPDKHIRSAELFEREYHALSQLAHPRIVGVYDYGIDEAGPYYTMELLDGGDLQQLAPLDWRAACAVARDICSALSLLHSRRLVHRDVSPRNIRRTQDGSAKLIDFGAMVPVGPSKLVVGTPPCCAPETLSMQALDGRTDLFALGATLYFMLVGRHAYGARQFSQLNDVWHAGFAAPSALQPDVPPALDALVFDLLRLEPDARPVNAAEVIQRLCAIDGEAPTEQLGVAEAYLLRPTLVGRELPLARVRRRLDRARAGQSFALIVEGAAGAGRSRFLDACVLDTALRGATVLRADADDAAASGEYGALRALARQLLTQMPATALQLARPHFSVLRQFIPELGQAGAEEPSNDARSTFTRPQLVAATQTWFRALAREKPLIVVVDDFHRIDESSTALLALLAHDGGERLGFLFSVEARAAWRSAQSHELLSENTSRVHLENLSRDDSDSLLKSLFGDVPNIGALIRRMHELSNGNPRDLLRLAQHLVDRRVVSYEAGAWTLASDIDPADLPNSMSQALHARLDTLSACARELANALALCPDQGFTFDECYALSEPASAAQLHADLDQLVRLDIVRTVDDRSMLAHVHWIALLRADLLEPHERLLHLRLAGVFERRGSAFRAGQHSLCAEDYAHGLDILVAHAAESQEQTARGSDILVRYARSLPADWLDTFDQAIRLCEALQRRKRDAFVLRGRLAGLVPAFGITNDRGHVATLIRDLVLYCGLADWQELENERDASQRVQRAIALAEARYAAQSEDERVIAPRHAMQVLSRAGNTAVSQAAISIDVTILRSLPALAAFAEVTPSLTMTSMMAAGVGARYSGHAERSRAIYLDVLAKLERPDHGMDPSYAQLGMLAMLNGLAIVDACMGLASSLTWSERAAASPTYQVHSLHARMLYHVFQGDLESAETLRKQAERLQLEMLPLYQSAYGFWEMTAHILAEDLTSLRHAMEKVSGLAARSEPWLAMHHFMSAEYDRIRRNCEQALPKIQRALKLANPGVHPLWASMACTHVRILFDLGRFDAAHELAERYVATAREHEIDHASEQLVLALSICKAHAGQPMAAQLASSVLDRLYARQCQGIHLGLAYEVRARVAILLKDEAGFARYAELCREIYCQYKNPALLAKYKRLSQEAQRRKLVLPEQTDTPDSYGSYTGTRIVAALEYCKGLEQRAQLALTILARQSGAAGGVLYTLGVEGLEAIGAVGGISLDSRLQQRVQEYFMEQMQSAADATITHSGIPEQTQATVWSDGSGHKYRPLLLSHTVEGSLALIGVALMELSSTTPFQYPAHVVSAISRFWGENSYTSMLLVSD